MGDIFTSIADLYFQLPNDSQEAQTWKDLQAARGKTDLAHIKNFFRLVKYLS